MTTKEEIPLPASVPKKRKQILELLDVHIAIWLAGDDITPSERRKLEEEKARRKQVRSRDELAVGVLIGPGGYTPAQLDRLGKELHGATVVHHPGVPSKVHSICKMAAPVEIHDKDLREVVRASQKVIGLPANSDPATRSAVWEMIRYAKHRSLPVTVILPSGDLQGEQHG